MNWEISVIIQSPSATEMTVPISYSYMGVADFFIVSFTCLNHKKLITLKAAFLFYSLDKGSTRRTLSHTLHWAIFDLSYL